MEEAWTEGTVLGLSRRICKDPTLRNDRVPTPIPPGMFGKPIEAEIKRKEIQALLDTESTSQIILHKGTFTRNRD